MIEKHSYTEIDSEWAGVPTRGGLRVPSGPLSGCIVLVHGFGEHSGRYRDSVIPRLLGQGWAVLTFDLVGHGRSGGRRGYCSGYDQLLDQVREACDRARSQFPGLPLVLYGHSMGGNLALNLVLRAGPQPAGLILSSPYLRLAFQPPAWKWRAGKFLRRIAPWITLPAGLDPNGISSQPEEVAAYENDPLVHDRVSPNYSFPVIEAGDWALENAHSLAVPLFIAHGDADPIIDPEGSRLLHERTPGSRLLLLEGNYHELHHDRGREALFRNLSDWLGHLASGAAGQEK